MKYNNDQVMNGIMQYANDEVISKLPTMGKWILGAGIGMISDKAHDVIVELQGNGALKILGVIDSDGNFDIDTLAAHMKESANRYGKAYIDIPMIGKLSFSAEDIDVLRQYIERA